MPEAPTPVTNTNLSAIAPAFARPTDTLADLPEAPDTNGETHVVALDGNGDFTSIQAAIDNASAGDTILINAGLYEEALSITGSDLTLRALGHVVLSPSTSSHGIHISGSQIQVEGIEIHGVTGEEFLGYSATGVVVAGTDITLTNMVVHNNGLVGILTLESSTRVLIDGGSVYDNTDSGISLGGGSHITIRGTDIYNTGAKADGEGNYQYQGIVMDNAGDVREIDGNVQFIEGQAVMENVVIVGANIHGHLGYGIRISAEHPDISTRPSGRIDTEDFYLLDNIIYENGSDLSDFVGGLYHLGGVLLQHIQGGAVEGNYVYYNYTWGMDIYNSSNLSITENLFVENNLGDQTEGVTIHSAGLEVNGGQNNTVTDNIIHGHNVGLVSDWIPDSGDDFTNEYAIGNHIIRGNVVFNSIEGDFEILRVDVMTRTIEGNLFESIPDWHVSYIRDEEEPNFETQNILGEDPDYTNPSAGNYSLQSSSPLRDGEYGFMPNALQISDMQRGTTGADTLRGTAEANVLWGGALGDRLIGGDGSDTITGGSGNDAVWAGAGDTGHDLVSGGAGNDVLGGGQGNDVLIGGNASTLGDAMTASSGSDTLFGGPGDDHLIGSNWTDNGDGAVNSADTFGNDASDGANTIWAGDGNDYIVGGGGNDRIGGGGGDDTVAAQDGDDVVFSGKDGDEYINGGAGDDTIYANIGEDTVLGGDGADLIFGGTGNDSILGGSGEDQIYSGRGNDTINGGGGNDFMAGHDDVDTFVFSVGSGDDRIARFTLEQDFLDLSNLGLSFTDLTIASNSEGIGISWDGGSVILLGLTEVPDAGDFIF